MRKICCFAGHGKIDYGEDVKKQVFNKCRELVEDYGVNEFWVGKYGAFDRLAADTVRKLRWLYPNIKLCIVLAYSTDIVQAYVDDEVFVAKIPEKTPMRYRIIKCNQYMVDKSKYLIAYVDHPFGGAAKTLSYACKKRKRHIKIFNLGKLKEPHF